MKVTIEKRSDFNDSFDYELIHLDELTSDTESEEPGVVSDEDFVEFNISENNDEYLFEIYTPGFRKEDFKIEVNDDGMLSIKAVSGTGDYFLNEEGVETEETVEEYYRSFTLPPHVDDQDITSYYDDGVLTLVIPKK